MDPRVLGPGAEVRRQNVLEGRVRIFCSELSASSVDSETVNNHLVLICRHRSQVTDNDEVVDLHMEEKRETRCARAERVGGRTAADR